ncbi:dol-P-Glc:Glc(2)Man(9)GlcNAc(2)-PP-Dol alpha-1,2-glucosyltransferase isoform X2 [Phalaenopsis equestris]|uniref:dol-P-Glc:Glc(2)Man(9)GlcNAc(2)-PP-Dol alpha-1,2-glucosyltransferase isoform X2 n=1 Tax=Phalaenopsis equestris TaxID=78828 RepID=UPI0009E4C087|nr:dol-P-Glc:Glc(2)Man(9)GlcNAc(2)-PP-Dol alpha-1,2-glucosyltransferase isoform X2 [Phalaenopsis equestris]
MGRMAVAAIVSLWVIPISMAVNRIVPDPYMDEIFHVPQAQRYCRGDFKTWDPMITTPPGLYYLSLAYVASLFPGMWFTKVIQSFHQLCSTGFLRSTNAIIAVVCSVIVYDLLISLRPSLSEKKATFYAVLIALYPLHWFFTFLYYTDVASLTAVLAMYLASLKKQFLISAMFGAFATLFRQTNVVWVAFVAATAAISYAENLCGKDCANLKYEKFKIVKKDVISGKNNSAVNPTLRKRRTGASKNSSQKVIHFHLLNDSGLVDEIVELFIKLWRLKWKVLVTFFPYLLVLVAFGALVVFNGGIVLGAKEAHVVSLHFAQLMYFGLAAAAALAPVHFTLGQASTLWQSLRRHKIGNSFGLLASLFLCMIFVHFFSIAHPYLLADNRHYTFYLWRKVIHANRSMKYLLVPLYIYSWLSLITAFASVAVLIPTPLIEFRYYTTPFYFLILNSKIEQNMKWAIIGILYASVNVLTMLMFLYRPFQWDHQPGIQRFIW